MSSTTSRLNNPLIVGNDSGIHIIGRDDRGFPAVAMLQTEPGTDPFAAAKQLRKEALTSNEVIVSRTDVDSWSRVEHRVDAVRAGMEMAFADSPEGVSRNGHQAWKDEQSAMLLRAIPKDGQKTMRSQALEIAPRNADMPSRPVRIQDPWFVAGKNTIQVIGSIDGGEAVSMTIQLEEKDVASQLARRMTQESGAGKDTVVSIRAIEGAKPHESIVDAVSTGEARGYARADEGFIEKLAKRGFASDENMDREAWRAMQDDVLASVGIDRPDRERAVSVGKGSPEAETSMMTAKNLDVGR